MPSLTNTNASDNAAISTPITNTSDNATASTPISNSTPALRQDSAQPRLILHLNAKQRKEAEAAARSLQIAGAALERYRWRLRLDGRMAPESWFTQPLLHSAHAAIETFNRTSHPGNRARRTFDSAKRRFDETSRLFVRDVERLLERELEEQRAAERMEIRDLPLRLRRTS
jgi:hypothetical protein